jgi:hypothetical protein
MHSTTLDRIFADRPLIHRIAERTDVIRPERTMLPQKMKDQLASLKGRQNYGITRDCANYLLEIVKPGKKTLETGLGVSTLIFGIAKSDHTAVAPNGDEMVELRRYAQEIGIDLSEVQHVSSGSEEYLPTLAQPLDVVLIDGMHAFPWPILDWYYVADVLRVGGYLLLDDTPLRPVSVLSEFLKADTPRWKFIRALSNTDVFQKTAAEVHDVNWTEQPWVAETWKDPQASFVQRIKQRLLRAH